MIKKISNTILFLMFLLPTVLFAQPKLADSVENGDLIFQRLPCGGLCDAIIKTTPCKPGLAFNHCGIIYKIAGRLYVVEAIGEAVQQTQIDDFLKRDTSRHIYIAKVKEEYRQQNNRMIGDAIKQAQLYIGVKYDDAFLPGDSALYCSELVWETYKDANKKPLFDLKPMTFKDPKTKKTFAAWVKYYKSISQPIPEGKPGINPCAIANSNKVRLIKCVK